MTVIALLDTEMSDVDRGLIDCMVGLPDLARPPLPSDFVVRTSGLGGAEVIGVTPLAGQRRNAYRVTVRFSADAGMLCIRYRPERTASHGKKQGAGVDVSVLGSGFRSTLDAGGDEWHLPLQPAVQPAQSETPSPAPLPSPAQVLPLQRPAKATLPPTQDNVPLPDLPDVAAGLVTLIPRGPRK